MRNAPAVRYPVGRSRFHGCLVLTIGGLGLAVISGWSITLGPAPALNWGALVLFAVVATYAAYRWKTTCPGELVWTGQVWEYSISGAGTETPSMAVNAVAVILDLQSTLLIRVWKSDGSNLWLWTERRQLPGRWLAHRRAVFGFKPKQQSANLAKSFGNGLHVSDPAFGSARKNP